VARGVKDGPVTEIGLDDWWRAINVNLYGVFLGCRFAVPAMIATGGGSIINMASLAGVTGTTGRDAYTATKGGVIALTRSVAKNFVKANVRVNAIAPGLVATEKADVTAEVEQAMGAMQGVPQLGQPTDIADACVFLASDESRFMTAAVLRVDGGVSSMLQIG
jgi:NAD(P)-dependent dehydrogenase (short-subunit alcohol dehydrogenase family)